jgi:hypothetical protein
MASTALQFVLRVAFCGLRPRLPHDIGAVGALLERYWDAEPARRPTMGAIIQELEAEETAALGR